MSSYSAQDIAKYFLSLVDETAGDVLTNLKLQKLLYYAQGFHLAVYGRPLFHETIEAWEYGPVVPAVYHALKKNGSDPIRKIGDNRLPHLPHNVSGLLDEINSVYGQFSALKLMKMTHVEPPWMNTPRGKIISHAMMRDYFKTRLRKK